MTRTPRGLFITGTDTAVGKTYVAALVARLLHSRGYQIGVYKPVASGCIEDNGMLISDDAVRLWEAAGRPGDLNAVCPQRFEAPLAPHLAAREAEVAIDTQLLRDGLEYWRKRSQVVLVEGVGGLMSPISFDDYNADLADAFGYPLIVVAPNQLGVINQTLQTLITAATFRQGLEVVGVVLNDTCASKDDVSKATNRVELEARCVPPVLAHVPWQATSIDSRVDWARLAQ